MKKSVFALSLILFFVLQNLQAQTLFEIGFDYGNISYRGLLRTNQSNNWTMRMKGYTQGRVVLFIEESIRATQQTEGFKLEGFNVRALPGSTPGLTYDADNFFMSTNNDGTKRFFVVDNAGRSAPVECVQIGSAYVNQKLRDYGW